MLFLRVCLCFCARISGIINAKLFKNYDREDFGLNELREDLIIVLMLVRSLEKRYQ